MRKGAPMESLGARTCRHPVVPKPVLNISEKQEQSLWPPHDLPEYTMSSSLSRCASLLFLTPPYSTAGGVLICLSLIFNISSGSLV